MKFNFVKINLYTTWIRPNAQSKLYTELSFFKATIFNQTQVKIACF